jgi:hypothetical protein
VEISDNFLHIVVGVVGNSEQFMLQLLPHSKLVFSVAPSSRPHKDQMAQTSSEAAAISSLIKSVSEMFSVATKTSGKRSEYCRE